jgi:anti-anti-sigma factor
MEFTSTRTGTVLHLGGELDTASVGRFHLSIAHAEGLIDTIDLRDLGFVDSCGVRALMVVRRRYPNVAIVNPHPRVARVVDVVDAGELVFGEGHVVGLR